MVAAIRGYFAAYRTLNRDVRLFFLSAAIIGFTNFGGIYAAIANLALLRFGYGPQFIGQVSAVSSFVMLATCLPVSALVRRFGSRQLILWGLGLNVLTSALLPAAGFLEMSGRSIWILMAVALNSISLGLYLVSSQPFLAGATQPVERGHAFSVQAAIWPLSGFAGSLLGGALPGLLGRVFSVPLNHPLPYQITLWIAAAISLFALFGMLGTRQEEGEAPQEVSTQHPQLNPWKAIAFLSLVVAVQIGGEGALRSFANVYLDDGLRLATSVVGLLLGIGQLAAGFAALLTPFFTARLGNERTYVLASLGISLMMLPLALIPSWMGAGLGYMGAIMMAQVARPAIITMQMAYVSGPYRAVMAAVTTMAASLGSGMMSLLGGYMIQNRGYTAFFLMAAVFPAIAALGFAGVSSRRVKF